MKKENKACYNTVCFSDIRVSSGKAGAAGKSKKSEGFMGEKIIEEAKKVNLTELFYDLVFVFGISKITHVLESLD